MAKKNTALIIVESPSKAHKIAQYVDKGITVMASVGHIRDLPTFVTGVNVANNFEPNYVIPAEKKKIVSDLQKAASKVSTVYLASDPDREGESIAWHLYEVLKDLPGERTFYRVRYNEVTKSAVLKALAEPSQIDQNLVDAQQARRIEDRLSGFKLSKLISSAVRGAKSAGRVQSVALRLIVDRERAIQAFDTTHYWQIFADLEKQACAFRARLASVDGVVPKFLAHDKEILGIQYKTTADAYMADLQARDVRVANIETKLISKRPQAPFITSTLQQAASNYLGFSPSQTMMLAQSLYENGYITYMRTDGYTVSATIRESVEAEITRLFGKECVPEKPNFYGNKVKNAQEAHEPIRPTDVTKMQIDGLEPQQAKLYDLIWRRFVASQMTAARYERMTITFEPTEPPATAHDYRLTASAQKVIFKGYLNVWSPSKHETEGEEDDAKSLPALSIGDVVTCNQWVCEAKETQPPARYNEASLIRALEENGIGRPSTYASTIQTLLARKYVTASRNHVLTPTETGLAATDYLLGEVPDFINVEFTAQMEDALDKVAEGSLDWVEKVREFYTKLMEWLSADHQQIAPLLAQLSTIQQWKAPTMKKNGKVAWDDHTFVTDMQEAIQRGEPITKSQFATLSRMAISYREQLPNLESILGPLPQTVDKAEVETLFEQLSKRDLNDWEAKFITSVKRQFESRGDLSEKQLGLLRKLAQPAEAVAHPENEAEAAELLALFATVKTWKDPVKRGRTTYDDKAFFDSLSEQLQTRHYLSERQFDALKRLVRTYREQIPTYDAIAEKYAIKAPAARQTKTAKPKAKRKTTKKA